MKAECGMMNEERLDARYASASEHVERLTTSLLAKAFRGELVSQEQG
jgi:hypothetical protein